MESVAGLPKFENFLDKETGEVETLSKRELAERRRLNG